ncbi:G-protein coupled receptor 171 [Erpetoichthys calabaricus]|uniref:G-protein coupled receptor 171 n=1 Tax=Erpetoichthys calabaricus TaxID=27687 RepID=A0A8C4S4G6_ERPCA|nr:G-protein coupled receptor 171 [Erpetoichthys calabaricus]XP_028650371.1 G-protein coupled receptor 171 [Erpetoichthys calabaricus]
MNTSTVLPLMDCTVNDQMMPFTYFYYMIFLIGIIGSSVALWAFIHQPKNSKSINVYLTNLLTSDFLLTLALPFKIAVDLGIAPWKLKIFHCQVSACLIYINMYVSIMFLAFVSADRYLEITRTSKMFKIQNTGFAKMMSSVIWLLLVLITIPNMLIPIKDISEKPLVTCAEFKTQLGLHWHTLTTFICIAIFMNASAVILISNGLILKRLCHETDNQNYKNVKRAMRNILIVTVGYVVCFVPYHIVRLPYTLTQNKVINDCSLRRSLFLAKESTILLAVLNLCFDPILYFYLSHSFREKVTEAFRPQRKTSEKIPKKNRECQNLKDTEDQRIVAS